MILAGILLGSPAWHWAVWLVLLLAMAVIGLGLSAYRQGRSGEYLPAVLKFLTFALIAACLVEPLWSSLRTRPGANLFLIVADDSASLTIQDPATRFPRSTALQSWLTSPESSWQQRLAQDFDVRRFTVGAKLSSVQNFEQLDFTGHHSAWYLALGQLRQRFADRPVAGVFLFTDGIVTDERRRDWSTAGLPPLYPVVCGTSEGVRDLAIENVAVSLTAFEDAPVTITAEILQQGLAGREVTARILDERQTVIKEEAVRLPDGQRSTSVRFQLRPAQPGLCFYTLSVQPSPTADGADIQETTLANNTRRIAVERGSGPYRILYVSGRPNWEFKFLNRALEADEQVKLTGLIRIARREPKFDWRGRAGESSNPLFRGFDGVDAETERFDQPVIVRLNTKDSQELREGFPKTAAELFPFQAVILDDLEAGFFTTVQLELLERYVSERGGSLLMLGGLESFAAGEYRKTPLSRVLPVSLDDEPKPLAANRWKLSLTRDGWLQPWARLQATESEEQARLARWPAFRTLNTAGREKPGATIIAAVSDRVGAEYPALVAHRYGEGRCAALLLGDFWRVQLEQAENDRTRDDLGKAWRQLVRWLIADVPEPIALRAEPVADDPAVMNVQVRVKSGEFEPQDNSSVLVTATLPDGSMLKLPAEPSLAEPGLYEALVAATQPGNYIAAVEVKDSQDKVTGTNATGWVHDPVAEEFRRVTPDRPWLETLARETGGEIVPAEQLDRFVETLSHRPAPITEVATTPLWQHPLMLVLIIAGLCGEWGLRRARGLP